MFLYPSVSINLPSFINFEQITVITFWSTGVSVNSSIVGSYIALLTTVTLYLLEPVCSFTQTVHPVGSFICITLFPWFADCSSIRSVFVLLLYIIQHSDAWVNVYLQQINLHCCPYLVLGIWSSKNLGKFLRLFHLSYSFLIVVLLVFLNISL